MKLAFADSTSEAHYNQSSTHCALVTCSQCSRQSLGHRVSLNHIYNVQLSEKSNGTVDNFNQKTILMFLCLPGVQVSVLGGRSLSDSNNKCYQRQAETKLNRNICSFESAESRSCHPFAVCVFS